MKYKNIFLTLVLSFIGTFYGHSQNGLDTLPDPAEDIAFAAKQIDKFVHLRWACGNPIAYGVVRSKGMNIYRNEISAYIKDGKEVVKIGKRVKINKKPITPQSLAIWKANFELQDTNAAAAVQCIHGAGLHQIKKGQELDNFFERHADQNNKLLILQLLADRYPKIAEFAGLGYIDSTAAPDKLYSYSLEVVTPPKQKTSWSASKIVQTVSNYTKPKMISLQANQLERAVQLYWDRESCSKMFNAFFIERSSDGKQWTKLNYKPHYSPIYSDTAKFDNQFMHYTDSVPVNYRPFHYRIIGVNAYGERSNPSTPIVANGVDRTPPKKPRITQVVLTETAGDINWEFKGDMREISGFYCERSYSMDGPWMQLHETVLPPIVRQFRDTLPIPHFANYYRVNAIDTAGNMAFSEPFVKSMNDSIPPNKPEDLSASVSETGYLSLVWKQDNSLDFNGYIVYFSHIRNGKYVPISGRLFNQAKYFQQLDATTLHEQEFIYIVAVDRSMNPSLHSDTITIQKPDYIPPALPVFTDFKVNDDYITLHWAHSSSRDLKFTHLLRSDDQGKSYKKLASLDAKTLTYKDSDLAADQIYHYVMIAEDDAKNVSDTSAAYYLRSYRASIQPPTGLNYKDGQLTWTNPSSSDTQFLLYNGDSQTSLKKLATVDQPFYKIDKNMTGKFYAIKCIKNGQTSPLSNPYFINKAK